jgi:hypothetical protein
VAFLGMQARGGKLHPESLILGAVQATKHRPPAPVGLVGSETRTKRTLNAGGRKGVVVGHSPSNQLCHVRTGVARDKS